MQQPGWFTDPTWAKPALLIQSLWGLGSGMIIYLAGLKDIPRELYEAASIDGANALRRLRHITLPLLTPTIFFNLVLGAITAFSFFSQALVASSAPTELGGGGGALAEPEYRRSRRFNPVLFRSTSTSRFSATSSSATLRR